MLRKAIVRPPTANFSEGLTTADFGPPDYRRALAQHEAYCAALEQCGLTLVRLEADPNYPDSCFVEDTAVMVNRKDNAESGRVPGVMAMLTRPGAPTRAGEVESVRAVLKQLAPEDALHQILPPGTLDGGDVCEAGDHYFIGLSARTNESGAAQFANFVSAHGYTTSFVDIRGMDSVLHLKSGLAYLGENRLVVTEALAARSQFAGFETVRVPRTEEYAANCLRINDCVLLAAGHDRFEQMVRRFGIRTIAIEMSEFQKMDGGLSCLSLRW